MCCKALDIMEVDTDGEVICTVVVAGISVVGDVVCLATVGLNLEEAVDALR